MKALRPEFEAALHQALDQFETPFYAYDLPAIQQRTCQLRDLFAGGKLLYALKANPRLRLLGALRALGLGAEAVSVGEGGRAYAAGFPPSEVLLSGPVKTPATLRHLQETGLPILAADSVADLERIADQCPGAAVLVRINPDLPVSTHGHLATGQGESQFGILEEDLRRALQSARGLRVLGLQLHAGSLLGTADLLRAYQRAGEIAERHGPFRVLDLGGGFGPEADLERVATSALKLTEELGAELWVEPGRSVTAAFGVLVTRCWGIKRTRRRYLLLDAGMTELIRPMLYGAEHPVLPLYSGGELEHFDLAGPACERGDVLAREALLPTPRVGDALAILEVGAYGASMSSSYLDHPRPLELGFDGQGFEIWRRPEEFSALWAGEAQATAPAAQDSQRR